MNIESKTPPGSLEMALTQLSLWAVGHFERLRVLKKVKAYKMGGHTGKGSARESVGVEVALPLVVAAGMSWRLYFAIGTRDQIVSFCDPLAPVRWRTRETLLMQKCSQMIVDTIKFDNMDQIAGCNQVVAALRELASWSEETY